MLYSIFGLLKQKEGDFLVLFFTMLIMAYIVTKTSIPANFFTVMGIPILVTAITFLLLVYLGKKLTKN